LVRLLLAHGADIDGSPDANPLICSVSSMNLAMVAELLAHGANVNIANEVSGIYLNSEDYLQTLNFVQFGDTALVWACENDSSEMIMALVAAGANPYHITKVNIQSVIKSKPFA